MDSIIKDVMLRVNNSNKATYERSPVQTEENESLKKVLEELKTNICVEG